MVIDTRVTREHLRKLLDGDVQDEADEQKQGWADAEMGPVNRQAIDAAEQDRSDQDGVETRRGDCRRRHQWRHEGQDREPRVRCDDRDQKRTNGRCGSERADTEGHAQDDPGDERSGHQETPVLGLSGLQDDVDARGHAHRRYPAPADYGRHPATWT